MLSQVLCGCLLLLQLTAAAVLEPFNLRIDRQKLTRIDSSPLVVTDSTRPTISWELGCQACAKEPCCRGRKQISFQVTAGTAQTSSYYSGIINSTKTQHMLSLDMGSDQQVRLTVTVCSSGSEHSCTSASGSFLTGLFHKDDWHGDWLGGFTALRGELQLPTKRITRASAFASGVGCFELTINGAPVSPNTFMEPGWNFVPTVRMMYRAFDVTDLLSNASNSIGVRLGFCKFGYQGSFCEGAHGSLPACRAFRLQMNVHYADGTQVSVSTSSKSSAVTQWFGTTSGNALRYTHLYHGEIWDHNVGDPLWDTPSFVRTADWRTAALYPAAGQLSETMTLHKMPPIGVTQNFTAVSITLAGPGFVYDFGQNIAGFCSMQVTATKGVVVTLKYGEVLKADGTVDMAFGDGSGINQANQTDQVVLAGTANETFMPLFTYHGFRYVQVEGLELPPSLVAHFVHTAVEKTGRVSFNSSYEILNRIQTAIEYTQLSNIHSHPTDCPQREKRGWTGDSQMTSGEASLNFDTAMMYSTWLQTMRDSQDVGCTLHSAAPKFPQANTFLCCDPKRPSFGCDYTGIPEGAAGFNETAGSIADVVPFMHVGGWPGDPTWGIAGATIPWEVMMSTGDMQIVEEHWDTSKAVVDFLTRQGDPAAGGLVTFGYYGDWLHEKCADCATPIPQVTGWSHLLGMSRLADVANATGRTRDAKLYRSKLAAMKAQYHKHYFNQTTGNYGVSQTANLLPLFLEIPPPEARASVARAFLENLIAHGNSTTSGIAGSSFMLQVLLQLGEHELALQIASRTSQPSWGYMVQQGPGTIWETWDDSTNSHNHPMFCASIGPYLYSLAGATQSQNAYQLGVHPSVAYKLGSAFVSVHTHAGQLAYEWQADTTAGRFKATVQVPHGLDKPVVAQLAFPPGGKLSSDLTLCETHSAFCVVLGHLQQDAMLPAGIVQLQVQIEEKRVAIELTGGRYEFQLEFGSNGGVELVTSFV